MFITTNRIKYDEKNHNFTVHVDKIIIIVLR